MDMIEIEEEFVPRGSGLERSSHKSTGLRHVTDVLRYIREQLGRNHGSGEFGDGRNVTMEVGFLWEDLLSYIFGKRMAMRPGEIVYDGIVGSPDGIGEDPLGEVPFVVEEFKATWKSMKRPITENWDYMMQAQAYCKMVGTNVCIFRILYLMGDYGALFGPRYRVFRLEFDDDELDSVWEMLKTHAAEMDEKETPS